MPSRTNTTRTGAATAAGVVFLAYIVLGVAAMQLSARAMTGSDMTARIESVAQHQAEMGAVVLLSLLTSFAALILGVALYVITRAVQREIALLGFACRVGEGVLNALPVATLGLLWLGTTGAAAADEATGNLLATFLVRLRGWTILAAGTLFAVGSTAFSWLLLRGRLVPKVLAGLGVAASVLLTIVLPLQLAGFVTGPVPRLAWLPMLLFEVALALWLIIRGITAPVADRVMAERA